MDMSMLGETTAKLMDAVEANPAWAGDDEASFLAVGIVAIIKGKDDAGEPMTFTRTFCSDDYHYQQVGLFAAGLETVRDGQRPDEL